MYRSNTLFSVSSIYTNPKYKKKLFSEEKFNIAKTLSINALKNAFKSFQKIKPVKNGS